MASSTEPAPHLVLVTLDTTRDDALRRSDVPTPHLDAWRLAGWDFRRAYSTVPETLPAHACKLSARLPAQLQLHENGRVLRADTVMLAQRLGAQGYATAAFISGFPLLGRFGLARGFEHYDEDFQGAERSASATNQRVFAYLRERAGMGASRPLFLWIHYFDPHDPYEPPAELLQQIGDPYLAEIAALDREIGRLREALAAELGDYGVLVVADHGEGRGDHGEELHGNLLYEGVMRVPMFASGVGVVAGEDAQPISIRAVHDLMLGWSRGGRWGAALKQLREDSGGVVMAEAMKPYLQYGWQPQVMAVEGPIKAIRDGGLQVFDVVADSAEAVDLSGEVELSPELRQALREAPVPTEAAATAALDDTDRQRLASMGYVSFQNVATLREDAPNPRDMVALFGLLDRASAEFSAGHYGAAAQTLERLRQADPGNRSVVLRLAVAKSLLGAEAAADALFGEAARLGGDSLDLQQYRALHALRFGRFEEAAAGLAGVIAEDPRRTTARAALIGIYERRGDARSALPLLRDAVAAQPASADLHRRLGEAAMALGATDEAAGAFERARSLAPADFGAFLQLGVLYQAQGRFDEARQVLDEAPLDHPDRALLLFKRAQLSVLLSEPDAAQRIAVARREATAETAELLARERLFDGY